VVQRTRVAADKTWRTFRRRPLQAIVAVLVVAGGLTTLFVTGSNANNTCYQNGYGYGYSSNGTYQYGYGQCATAPATTTPAAPVLPSVAVQGPSNSLWYYWETPDSQWHGPLGVGIPGSTLSSPSATAGAGNLPVVAVQAPSNSLWYYWETPDAQWHGPLGIGNAGSTNASPSIG